MHRARRRHSVHTVANALIHLWSAPDGRAGRRPASPVNSRGPAFKRPTKYGGRGRAPSAVEQALQDGAQNRGTGCDMTGVASRQVSAPQLASIAASVADIIVLDGVGKSESAT